MQFHYSAVSSDPDLGPFYNVSVVSIPSRQLLLEPARTRPVLELFIPDGYRGRYKSNELSMAFA